MSFSHLLSLLEGTLFQMHKPQGLRTCHCIYFFVSKEGGDQPALSLSRVPLALLIGTGLLSFTISNRQLNVQMPGHKDPTLHGKEEVNLTPAATGSSPGLAQWDFDQ